MREFGSLEREVMAVVWASSSPLSVRDVLAALPPSHPVAYTTVMTILDRLTRKGFLTRERDGKAFRYSATVSREDHVARLMHEALESAADRTAALTHFAARVTDEEADALRRALTASRRNARKAAR